MGAGEQGTQTPTRILTLNPNPHPSQALLLNSSRILKSLRLRAAAGGGEGAGGKVTKQELGEALATLGLGELTALVDSCVD